MLSETFYLWKVKTKEKNAAGFLPVLVDCPVRDGAKRDRKIYSSPMFVCVNLSADRFCSLSVRDRIQHEPFSFHLSPISSLTSNNLNWHNFKLPNYPILTETHCVIYSNPVNYLTKNGLWKKGADIFYCSGNCFQTLTAKIRGGI